MRLNTRPSVCEIVLHHQRLGRARQPGNQAVASHEQRNQNLIEHVLLADDYLPHLRENILAHALEAFHAISKFGGVKIELRCC